MSTGTRWQGSMPAGEGPRALERLRDAALFLRRSARNPQQICSILPSSPRVGQAMARAIAGRPAEAVVELGGGVGPVTRVLLECGIDPALLTTVELDPVLAERLGELYPDIEVLNVGAQELSAIWHRQGRDKVGRVVSTLPLRIFDADTMDAVLKSTFAILAPGGCFVQFTYRFASPVDQEVIDRFGLTARRSEIAWANLPPASIWVYSRKDEWQPWLPSS